MYDFMNRPVTDDFQAKYVVFGTDTWVVCPICGKKAFPLTSGALIQGQFFQCRKCKQQYEVNTDRIKQSLW